MSQENIKGITKSNRNFVPTFVDHNVLPHINFNGLCLINNYVCIPKKSNKSIYFLHNKSIVTKFKHRFYIK